MNCLRTHKVRRAGARRDLSNREWRWVKEERKKRVTRQGTRGEAKAGGVGRHYSTPRTFCGAVPGVIKRAIGPELQLNTSAQRCDSCHGAAQNKQAGGRCQETGAALCRLHKHTSSQLRRSQSSSCAWRFGHKQDVWLDDNVSAVRLMLNRWEALKCRQCTDVVFREASRVQEHWTKS